MTPADWRALLEAFVARRIGADAFQRRYLEGWRANRDAGQPNPPPVDDLFIVVEAYDPDFEQRSESASDEQELEQAAARALARLKEEGGAPSRSYGTYDRARAREEMRRFQVDLRRVVGFGCLIALAWIGLWILQIFAVTSEVELLLDLHPLLTTAAGVVLAFVPVVGNILAFLGATKVWDWPVWLAVLVFFAAPALTLISAWLRWMRR